MTSPMPANTLSKLALGPSRTDTGKTDGGKTEADRIERREGVAPQLRPGQLPDSLALLEALPIAIFSLDHENNVISLNGAAEALLGSVATLLDTAGAS